MGVFLVGCVIASYWTVSTTLVFANKKLVSLIGTQTDFSLFIVWFQCIIGALFLFLASTLSRKVKLCSSNLNSLRLDKEKLVHLDMIISSSVFVVALIFNSVLLKYISVSFYQIARSLTIIFVLIMSAAILRERFMLRNLLACLLIICGFYVGVHEELYSYGVQIEGVFYGAVTSLFSALSSTLWLCCLLVGWISTLQISLTSPLTYIISTNSKSVFQTLLAVLWNSETRSWVWWMGNILVMTGIVLYAVCSMKKEKAKPTEIIIKDTRKID
ncbi:hypothetical protein Btru_052664 [Bulinus truncatus]|nr:hypothetical protein Btru_052664 [Bulinus truncatus]